MDVICINDSYSKEQLDFFAQHGVNYPKKDKLYTVREICKNSDGSKAIRLVEIINPTVPLKYWGTVKYLEPNFAIKRFTNLLGKPLSKEEIEEFINEEKLIKKNEEF